MTRILHPGEVYFVGVPAERAGPGERVTLTLVPEIANASRVVGLSFAANLVEVFVEEVRVGPCVVFSNHEIGDVPTFRFETDTFSEWPSDFGRPPPADHLIAWPGFSLAVVVLNAGPTLTVVKAAFKLVGHDDPGPRLKVVN